MMTRDDLTPKQRKDIARAAEKFRRSVAGLDVTISAAGRSTRIRPDGSIETADDEGTDDE